MRESVLVVEDEPDVVDLIRYHLNKAELDVLIANDGHKALALAREHRPNLVILDIMMPELDGYTVCRTLKADPKTADLPVVMLTAKSELSERVRGLELGADDYVTKPFSPRELVLRVQALLRRSRTSTRSENLVVDDFEIDRSALSIRLEGERLELTATEFKLLALLIDRRGRTQTRETLLYDVWGYQNSIDTRTVDTHVRRLREKLNKHASRLETIRGEGYRFLVSPN